MALIQLWNENDTPSSTTPKGSGQGSVNARAGTATVNSWDTKPALTVGTKYKLKSGGKHYEGNCATKSDVDPVATFNNVD